MGFVEELQWRGMVQDVVPGTDELLAKGSTPGYIGFDPTADSLHVGNLVPIMLLVHFQQAGHKPIALVGGATGMVGDPSGKKEERQLLTEEVIRHNVAGIKKQLEHFLDFDHPTTGAEVVNNLDWFKDMGFLQFIRDVGKHISVNYMMAKDSVKNRLEDGISFTEFSYQLVQGYDFYWLHQNKGCRLQMGGSDQWGNITTGTELIRRMGAGEAFALTCPLLTKQDGSKFGKSEAGNVWLDPERTSAYKFYQFWLNASDEDASKLVRYFTTWDHEKIVALENEHAAKPHERALQKALAKDITKRVHGEAELNSALQASEILFGKSNAAALTALSVKQLKEVFEGVPQASIARSDLQFGIDIIDLLSVQTDLLRSKGEARRALREGSISVNRNKVTEDRRVGLEDLLSERFILLQRGKKNYFLVEVE